MKDFFDEEEVTVCIFLFLTLWNG